MKKLLRPASFLILLTLMACGHRPAPRARAMAVDSLYDFGPVTKADTLRHTFFLKNTGTAYLHIETIAVSCNCMTLSWEKKPVKPGEKGYIQVAAVLPPGGAIGRYEKFFMVRTNAINSLSVFKIFYTHSSVQK